MIWADTQYVGCSMATKACEPGRELTMICLYYPMGNIEGQEPYKKGELCSECGRGKCPQQQYPPLGTTFETLDPATKGFADAKGMDPIPWDLSGLCINEPIPDPQGDEGTGNNGGGAPPGGSSSVSGGGPSQHHPQVGQQPEKCVINDGVTGIPPGDARVIIFCEVEGEYGKCGEFVWKGGKMCKSIGGDHTQSSSSSGSSSSGGGGAGHPPSSPPEDESVHSSSSSDEGDVGHPLSSPPEDESVHSSSSCTANNIDVIERFCEKEKPCGSLKNSNGESVCIPRETKTAPEGGNAEEPDLLAAGGNLQTTLNDQIVAQHNKVRSETARGETTGSQHTKLPAASNLKPLQWSETLAQVATESAEECKFKTADCGEALEKTGGRGLSGYSKDKPCGENLAANSNEASWSTISDGIKSWAAESEKYQYGSFQNGDLVAGHFTQMIWADTQYIGCGVKTCSKIEGISWGGTFLVCNYYPAGNILGQLPYKTGTAASEGGYEEEPDLLAAGGNLATTYKNDIVAQHNEVRTETADGETTGSQNTKLPAASKLKPLQWSESLAQVATEWANGCHFGHNPDRNKKLEGITKNDLDGYSRGSFCGENIAANSKEASWDTISHGIKSWAKEAEDYQYGPFQSGGPVVGHFTQMIWADTQYVGCGVKYCSKLGGFPAGGTFLVCNYYPAGNMVGQKPYET